MRFNWCKTNLHPTCYDYAQDHCDGCNIARAYQHGYETGQEDMSKTGWIPVSERLPEAREGVILSTKEWTGEGCYWETTKHHVIWKGYRWDTTYWDDEVIAWMPLPEPYTERQEK